MELDELGDILTRLEAYGAVAKEWDPITHEWVYTITDDGALIANQQGETITPWFEVNH